MKIILEAEIPLAGLQPVYMIDAATGEGECVEDIKRDTLGTKKKISQGICDLLWDHVSGWFDALSPAS
jgi:hypothetical protein